MLLQTTDDLVNFCDQAGLDQLAKVYLPPPLLCTPMHAIANCSLPPQVLSEKVVMARKEEDGLSKEELDLFLGITSRATKWMASSSESVEKRSIRILQAWESKV